MNRRMTWLAAGVLTAVLVVLAVITMWSLASVSRADRAVAKALNELSVYHRLQRVVAAEAFAEAGYRRAPSVSSRQRLEAVLSEMRPAIDQVAQLHGAADAATAAQVAIISSSYRDEILAELNHGELPVLSDDRVAGPALDSLQLLIDSGVNGKQADAHTAVAEQDAVFHRMLVVQPASMVLAFVGLAVSWTIIARYNARLRDESQLNALRALTDPLTGLGNRALFETSLDRLLATSEAPVAILMLDLNDFKAINDTYGHAAGDLTLIEVAERVSRCIRGGDIACRLGGDEFAVIVRPALEVETVARRLAEAIAVPVRIGGAGSVRPGSATGWAISRPGQDRASLLKEADQRLYANKRAQRDSAEGTDANVTYLRRGTDT